MDIAMRLLKEEKPWDMYSDWRYLKNPDNPDLRSDEPFTCGLYPEHHRLAGEIDTDSMFGGCGKTKPLSEFTRHILTNPQWKTSGQRGPSHPDYGKIGPEQVICNDCKARSYARFAPLANAIQEHIEENPDFDPNTQELGKLPPGMKIPNEALVDPDEDKWRSDIETGEPMDLAIRLLKMPLLDEPPETYQNPNLKNPQQIYQFQDPVTEEVQDLHIAPAANPESNTLYAGIGDRAYAKFNDLPSGDYMSLDGVKTDEEFQQRGYMTAIYDALENYLREHKGDAKLLPSDFQSEGGKALWANRKLTGEPMDLAWQMLKMPIVDTAAGVSVAYGDLDEAERERMQGHWSEGGPVGSAPFVNNRRDGPVEMTPNEYFDLLGAGSPDSKYRWTGRFPTKERNEKIASMVEALQSGAVMGAPRLAFGGDEDEPPELFRQGQEGGHRMEALRQMGHGDTPIPVWNWYTR